MSLNDQRKLHNNFGEPATYRRCEKTICLDVVVEPATPRKYESYLDFVDSLLKEMCVKLSLPASVIESDGDSNYSGKSPHDQ